VSGPERLMIDKLNSQRFGRDKRDAVFVNDRVRFVKESSTAVAAAVTVDFDDDNDETIRTIEKEVGARATENARYPPPFTQ